MTVTTTINGQTYTLTYNSSSGNYEATLNAPQDSSFNLDGGYYPVSVSATDDAGNKATVDSTHSTLGESLRLVVKEKVKPTISITSPSQGALNTDGKPVIAFKLLDNTTQTSGFSGVDLTSLVLKINGSAIAVSSITTTAVTGGYSCTYTPTTALPDGSNTISIVVSDNDGNTSDTANVTFTIDTVAPSLNVSSPTEGFITNSETIEVIGTTSDVTSSPVEINIYVGNTSQGSVTVNSDGSFSHAITLEEGVNTIRIIATDSAGKRTTVERTVTLKTNAPVITSVVIEPNPADAGKTYTIKVTVDEG